MLKYYLIIVYLGHALCSSAQKCSCHKLVVDAINKTEANYAGFREKTSKQNQNKYNHFKQKILKKSKEPKVECIEVIDQYFSFFKDSHLILNENKSGPIIINQNDIPYQNDLIDPILGEWYSDLDQANIRVIKKNNQFLGYIISSADTTVKPGTLVFNFKKKSKVEYSGITYNKYGQKIIYESVVKDDYLVIRFLETLTRIRKNVSNDRKFIFSRLNDTVSYVKYPSFSPYYRKQCDSLIENNRAVIESSKYLVVDLTDNHGGSIYSFSKLFDYIYTNPTKYVSGSYLASDDNIHKAVEYLQELKLGGDSADIKSFENFIGNLKRNRGKFYFELPDTLRKKRIYPFPQTIVFLINENTASAAEMLLIMACQNKKTVVAGSKTYGASDYLEPQFYYLCDKKYLVGIPWIKRSRLEYKKDIDGIGISPAIDLKHIAENEWVNTLFKNGFLNINK